MHLSSDRWSIGGTQGLLSLRQNEKGMLRHAIESFAFRETLIGSSRVLSRILGSSDSGSEAGAAGDCGGGTREPFALLTLSAQ